MLISRLWLLRVAGHAYDLQGCLIPVCSLVDTVATAAAVTGKGERLLRGARRCSTGPQRCDGNVCRLVLCLYVGQTGLEEVDIVLGVDLPGPRWQRPMASALSQSDLLPVQGSYKGRAHLDGL